MGFTTVLSMHIEKPENEGSGEVDAVASRTPCEHMTHTPAKPTAMAVRAVFLYPIRWSIMPAGMPMKHRR